MQLSTIATLFTLVISVVSRVPSLSDASSTLFDRDATSLGCVDPNGDDQHIEFHSGGNVFSMRVPMDNNNYNIGKPAAQMKCTSETAAGNPCVACWDKMDHVEITRPGSCCFMLTDSSGKLFSMQADNTQGMVSLSRPGYLALVTCNPPQHPAVRIVEDAQLNCGPPEDLEITLFTGSEYYMLLINANLTIFDIVGPDSTLGCKGPLHRSNPMCQACNFPVQSLKLNPDFGTCAFDLAGYPGTRYITETDGTLTLPGPTQILSLSCGLALKRREVIPEALDPATGQTNAKVNMEHSVKRVTDNAAMLTSCFNLEYVTSIIAVDGQEYCAPVHLDNEFHPMKDITCLRPFPYAFIPCDQVPAATTVSANAPSGQCTFFTEDHRAFFSQAEIVTLVAPANAISGIMCPIQGQTGQARKGS